MPPWLLPLSAALPATDVHVLDGALVARLERLPACVRDRAVVMLQRAARAGAADPATFEAIIDAVAAHRATI